MAEKPSFPKISLKYQSLEAFAKAARKCFKKGRMMVKLKRDFESGQRILMFIQLADIGQCVEIIGQVNDRVEAKEGKGFNYGVRFLNFSESKLNRLLASESLKPAPAPQAETRTEAPTSPEEPAQQPEPEAPSEPEPPGQAPAPEAAEPPLAEPVPTSQARPAFKFIPVNIDALQDIEDKPYNEESEEDGEEEVVIQSGKSQRFGESPPATEPEPLEQPKPEPEKEPDQTGPEPAPVEETKPTPQIAPVSRPLIEDSFNLETESEPVESVPVESPAPESAPEEKAEDNFEPKTAEPEAAGQEPAAPEPEAASPAESAGAMIIEEEDDDEEQPEQKLTVETPAEGNLPEEDLPEENLPEETAPASAPAAKPENLPEEKEAAPVASPKENEHGEFEFGPDAEQEDFSEELPEAPVIAKAVSAPKVEQGPEVKIKSFDRGLKAKRRDIIKKMPAPPPEEKAPAPPPVPTPVDTARTAELKPVSPKILSDFLFRFCKMILNPPDPKLPDSAKNIASLFDDFQKIMQSRDRLAIYLVQTPAGKDFLIEGIQPVARSIRIVLPPDLSGSLIFRTIELFDQKELIGIIFRKFVDLDRFSNFILELGKFNPEKEKTDALALRLIYMGVYHFNLIFETDLVAVPQKIEEETKIILARFSGELKRLVSLANQISEEPLALLTLRMEDIVKPVRNPIVVAQMLEHLALVWNDQIEGLDFSGFEDQILFSIPVPLLLDTLEIFARKLSEIQSSTSMSPKQKEAARGALLRLLKRAMARIAYEAPEQALEPLSQLFSKKIIRYEELPPEIRDQMAASMLATNFLKDSEKKLKDLEIIKAPGLYGEVAGQILWTAVALVDQGQMGLAREIFTTLVAHFQDQAPPFPDRPQIAREVLKKLSEPTAVAILARLLEQGRKEERELSASMLYAAGEGAGKRLLAMLETSEDHNVRRMICEILFRYGEKAVPLLMDELGKPDIAWYVARNLLKILAEIKTPTARPRGEELLKHPHPRVREEALGYLFAVGVMHMEQTLRDSLSDPEVFVRRRALGCMAQLDKLSDESLNRIYAVIKESANAGHDPENELYFSQAVDIIAKSSTENFADGAGVNNFFFETLEQTEKGLFSRAKLDLTPKMKIALIDALGRRKVMDARKMLGKLSKDKDPGIKRAAQKALEQLGAE